MTTARRWCSVSGKAPVPATATNVPAAARRRKTVTFTAKNPIGARRGELVKVESETAPVLKAAAVLYVVPLVLFSSGYYLGFRLGGFGALVGGLGFVLGIALVLVYDRKVVRKANIDYTISAFARKI